MTRQGIELGALGQRRDELAATGRTAIVVAIDDTAAAVIGIAGAARETSPAAVAALHDMGIEVVMLTGDNRATAERIAAQLNIDAVIALPIAAGIFEPGLGLQLRPEWAAIAMSGSSFIVATNALLLKRLHLPTPPEAAAADRIATDPIATDSAPEADRPTT